VGVDYWCTACHAANAVYLYHKRRKALSKSELQELRGKINKRQNARRKQLLAGMSPDALAKFRKSINSYNVTQRAEIRDLVYKSYGGYRCACCGETEPKFLSIDHINNDGAKHKREFRIRTGEQMYRWLVRNKFPQGFQILCMNCQWGKRNNCGICPHQSGNGVTTIPKGSTAKRPEAQRSS